ncbi:GNAT family N-acetyltransferase [bacterium]|nr:GNAT family N-acetyltransferase [bacterium]
MTRTIRKYRETDLEAVISAWESTQSLAHPFLPDAFQQQEKKNIRELYLPNADTWVVEEDGQVVGFIALIGNEIGGLFVQPAHHGRKLGKQLVDKARELHGDLVVEVFEKNAIGRHFYAQYGFTEIESKLHRETGEAVLRLEINADIAREQSTAPRSA